MLHDFTAVPTPVLGVGHFKRALRGYSCRVPKRIEQLTATVKDHGSLFEVVIKDIQDLDRKFSRQMRLLKAPPRSKARIGFLVPDVHRN
jgi:hypothetical protein